MWKVKFDPNTMQGWQGCNDLITGQSITLTDTRDDSTYTVAKLKDNKCWMTQNLRIVNHQVSSSDSAIEDVELTIPSSDINNFKEEFDEDVDTAAVYYDGNTSHGAYYNWYTATAGSGTSNLTEGDIYNSICPKGWHLPLQSEYQMLYDAYPSNGLTNDADGPKFTAFGYVYNKAVRTNTYTYSYYWSSSAGYEPDMVVEPFNMIHALSVYSYNSSSYASVSGAGVIYGGLIRCVAGSFPGQRRSYTITYDANGGNAVNPQTGNTYSDSVKIKAYSPYWNGNHKFLGWCTVNPGSSTSCSGKLYQPEESITLNNVDTNINLYATWSTYPLLSNFRCSSLQNGQNTQVWCSNCKNSPTASSYYPHALYIYKDSYGICHGDSFTASSSSAASSYCSSLGGGMRLQTASECTSYRLWGWTSSGQYCDLGKLESNPSNPYGYCYSTN